VHHQLHAANVSPERLDRTLREVMEMQIRIPDRAIVVALKKLKDPETDNRGRTATEAASEAQREDDALTTRWRRDQQRAIDAWIEKNPEAFAELDEQVRSSVVAEADSPGWAVEYRGRLAQAIAAKTGAPTYDDWKLTRGNGAVHE
jgi:hypothetical protein